MYVKDIKDAKRTYTYIFAKLILIAFQPYHQILHMLKHVEDVEGRNNL